MSTTAVHNKSKQDGLFDTARLRDIVSFMLEEAKRHGATAAEAGLSVITDGQPTAYFAGAGWTTACRREV